MIRIMEPSDWARVAEIYTQGIEKGDATVSTVCPSYAEWDAAYRKDCRLVAIQDGQVVGWVAILPTSAKKAYWGVVEVSIYIDEAYQGRGIGTALMHALFEESEKCGYWTLYSAIFSINTASIALHKKCGFREIGYRERVAKDRFGNWQNTTIMERRRKD